MLSQRTPSIKNTRKSLFYTHIFHTNSLLLHSTKDTYEKTHKRHSKIGIWRDTISYEQESEDTARLSRQNTKQPCIALICSDNQRIAREFTTNLLLI